MSNRQARREQSRIARQARPSRSGGRPSPSGQRPSNRRGGGGLLSNKFLIAVGVIIVGAIVAVILVARFSGSSSSADQQMVSDIQTATNQLPLSLANGTKLGKDSAPLKLTTFVDFQCPFCLKFMSTQEPTLINEYVKTGKMQIIVKPYPILGNESVQAAEAGQCAANQNKFWPFYEKLYLTEAQAGQYGNEQRNVGRFSQANLIKYAGDVGMNVKSFTSCLNGGNELTTVQNSVRAAQGYGITATPGFLINGTPIGSGTPATIADWRKALNQILNATPTPTGSATKTSTPSVTATPTP